VLIVPRCGLQSVTPVGRPSRSTVTDEVPGSCEKTMCIARSTVSPRRTGPMARMSSPPLTITSWPRVICRASGGEPLGEVWCHCSTTCHDGVSVGKSSPSTAV
jgi:hypothetical protein